MTLFRSERIRSIKTTMLTIATLLITSSWAAAFTIISPTEGSMVREKVKIVVPRSAIRTDGFISISIDGMFRAAAAMPEEMKKPNQNSSPSPYYTYIWDTKAPVVSFKSGTEPVYIKDGKHEIEVMVHDTLGRKEASAKVTVNVANKAAMTNPAPPIKMYYRYYLGDQKTYRCKVEGEILDNLGQPLLSGVSAINAEFDIIQSIEETRKDGSALVRYKVGKDAVVQIYGRQIQMAEAATTYPSIYKEIDKFGKTLQSNIVRKTTATITDVLPRFPAKPVKIGESWPSEFKLKIEGIGDIVPFQMTNVLDSVEWEGGQECAKIVSKMTGMGKLNLIPGNQNKDDQTPATGTGTFFFAYKTGKLIKAVADLEASMSIDPAMLSSLQQGSLGGPDGGVFAPQSNQIPSEDLEDSGPYGGSRQYRPRRKPTATIYGPEGGTVSGPEKTTVKVKLNWSLELKK